MMPSLFLPSEVVTDERKVARDELEQDVLRAAAGIAERGVRAGDRVVVSLWNTYEFVVVDLALDLLGAVTVNLPTAFRREVGQVVRLVDARLAILHDADDLRMFGDVRDAVVLGSEPGALQAISTAADPPDPVSREPNGKRWLAFTSGSTGTPRAAVHTRATLAATTRGMGDRYGIGQEDAVLVAAPVGHAIGFCYGVRLACDRGARMVLLRRWDPERALALVDRERCSFAAVPTPFLADLIELRKECKGRLRHLLVGGAPIVRDQLCEADELLGAGVASSYYGSSECGATTTCPPGAPESERLQSDGRAMPEMELRIVDEEGRDVPDGQEGELLVRGPQVALGYWANNDSDHQFLQGGWFATRDRAARRPSGYVAITGRLRDIIIRGAVNVVPREVEEAVAAHPRIGRCVVVGRPDDRLGEAIVAVATARGEAPSLDELRGWLRECGLSRSKWPDALLIVDELPRNPAGKIDRRRVREELLAGAPE